MSTDDLQHQELPPWIWPRAAYIHIPFCAHHCGYCDFAVVEGRDDAVDSYLDALAAELSCVLPQPQFVRTLFIGGGTPTHLSPNQLSKLFEILQRWFRWNSDCEISVEANPSTLTTDKINVLADCGVNRVSLGAQSFDAPVLRMLERDHAPSDIIDVVIEVKRRIERVSLDLIFGVPGQSLTQLRNDLRSAIELHPTHVSTYGLTYEQGTRLWKQLQRGEVQRLTEQVEYDMYQLAIDQLSNAGYEHYEISNFAGPQKRCRHNETYWANEAYWGFGMGAVRYVRFCRDANTRDLAGYIQKAMAQGSTLMRSEELSAAERAYETMALQLRRSDGIHFERFTVQTEFDFHDLAGDKAMHHIDLGLLAMDAASIRLTEKGKFVADAVIQSMFDTGRE